MRKNTDNFIVFQISGGIGKNILATAVVRALKDQYPDSRIVILTAYKDVWMYNPNVYRIHTYEHAQYFYDDYIRDKKNTLIFSVDPYSTSDYILKKKHLIDIWCDLVGVERNGGPELFFNKREVEWAKNTFVQNQPYMVLQTNGGMNPNIKQSWYRDIPIDLAQKVVDDFSQRMKVIHLRREDQLELRNTNQFKGSMRECWLLLSFATKTLLMDSMGQHALAALGKPSTVLWVGNDPLVLGYSIHDNIKARDFDVSNTSNAILEPYNISGLITECPYLDGTDDLFDLNEVIQSIKAQ